MKSVGVNLKRTYLTRNCKKKRCATSFITFSVWTIMQVAVSFLLMLQKYVNSKQKFQKTSHIHCVYIKFRQFLLWITWKNKQTNKQTNKKTILKGVVKVFYVDYNVIYLYVFGFVEKMFVGLLSVCAIGSFATSSALTSQNIRNVYL